MTEFNGVRLLEEVATLTGLRTDRQRKIDRLVRRWLDHVDWDPRWVLEHPTGHLWVHRAVCGWWL